MSGLKCKQTRPHSSHERWLVSYADFVTLLFAFFVVLYASSKADLRKQAEIASSIDSAFRVLGLFQTTGAQAGTRPQPKTLSDKVEAVSPVNIVMGDEMLASPEVQKDFARIKKDLEGLLSNQIAQHIVSLRIGREGLVISLREVGFYESGSVAPQSSSAGTITQIAQALKDTPYDIRVEGHTDNVPIHSDQFESNWELSAARATRMARMFVEERGFAPYRLSAAGYGEFHPVAPNDTEDGRSQNRRIDIVVLPRASAPTGMEARAQGDVAAAVTRAEAAANAGPAHVPVQQRR